MRSNVDSVQTSHSEDAEDSDSLKNTILNYYCWTLIGLALYVVSFGPMYWFWYESAHLGGSPLLHWFYWPLVSLCEVVEPLNEVMNSYVELWAT